VTWDILSSVAPSRHDVRVRARTERRPDALNLPWWKGFR